MLYLKAVTHNRFYHMEKQKHNTEKILIKLKDEEIAALQKITKSGQQNARTITRARILLLSRKGKTNAEIVDTLGCSPRSVSDIRKRYIDRKSIADVLKDAPRPGQPKKITAEHEAFIAATACTDAPDGHGHWTLEALQKKLLETYSDLESVSHEWIRHILIRSALKPWREKMWCMPKLTPEFRERMDDILALYTEPLLEGEELEINCLKKQGLVGANCDRRKNAKYCRCHCRRTKRAKSENQLAIYHNKSAGEVSRALWRRLS